MFDYVHTPQPLQNITSFKRNILLLQTLDFFFFFVADFTPVDVQE